MVILHGINAWKVFFIIYANYALSRSKVPGKVSKFWPAIVIGGNMGVLLFNDRFDGWDLSLLHPILQTPVSRVQDSKIRLNWIRTRRRDAWRIGYKRYRRVNQAVDCMAWTIT